MKSFYLLLLALAISAVSCRTKEGAPGPAGVSNLKQQGSISGKITYDNNGTSVDVPFTYEYFESLNENQFYYYDGEAPDLYYELGFSRRDSKDVNNYFDVQCNGYGLDGVEDAPSSTNVYFSLLVLVNNELLEFTSSGGTITNVKLDPTTGRLTFDYTNDSVTLKSNAVPATFTAKVDVILNRSSASISPE